MREMTNGSGAQPKLSWSKRVRNRRLLSSAARPKGGTSFLHPHPHAQSYNLDGVRVSCRSCMVCVVWLSDVDAHCGSNLRGVWCID